MDEPTLDRLIGRMLIVGVRGFEPGQPDLEGDLDLCARRHVRGVILFDKDANTGGVRNIVNPQQTKKLIAHIKQRLGPGTIVSVDQEGGAVARLKEEAGFAPHVSAEEYATMDVAARERVRHRQAGQLASLGFNLVFAPCVDVNVNPDCAIIGAKGRSFSDESEVVIRCAQEWMRAYRQQGVMTCLKHYPGHGSATGDTHEGLVDITDTFDSERELAPYRTLVREAPMVMVGHLADRNVDAALPASLSRAHIKRLRGLEFGGVIATDALDMRAIEDNWGIEEAAARAVEAGVDLLIHAGNAPGVASGCAADELHRAVARALANSARGAGQKTAPGE